MIGSLAAFEIEAGDAAAGLALAGRAGGLIGGSGYEAPRAWLAAIEALAHVSARAAREADDALERAGQAVERAAAEPPVWPWLFPFDHAKLAGYRALVSVRLGRPDDALAAFAVPRQGTAPPAALPDNSRSSLACRLPGPGRIRVRGQTGEER